MSLEAYLTITFIFLFLGWAIWKLTKGPKLNITPEGQKVIDQLNGEWKRQHLVNNYHYGKIMQKVGATWFLEVKYNDCFLHVDHDKEIRLNYDESRIIYEFFQNLENEKDKVARQKVVDSFLK